MTTLTIKTKNEQYNVVAGVEFVPNFVKHIMNRETVSVFDGHGKMIGGNSGVGKSLTDWYINHPDVDTNKIKNGLLSECERVVFK